MKVTTKAIKHEVETAEVVCEITQYEFDKLCAEVAAQTTMEHIGKDADIDDLFTGLAMTSLFAEFVSKLDERLFDTNTENTQTEKEEK